MLLNAKTIMLEPSKPEITKVVLECPRCCWIFEAERPDTQHSNCSFNKPEDSKIKSGIIEEPRVCRNPKCKKQFTLYWYRTAKPNSNA
jgi:uncharacterized C2H2 Zn-finger protein